MHFLVHFKSKFKFKLLLKFASKLVFELPYRVANAELLVGRALELKLIIGSASFASYPPFRIQLTIRLIQGIDEIFSSTSF